MRSGLYACDSPVRHSRATDSATHDAASESLDPVNRMSDSPASVPNPAPDAFAAPPKRVVRVSREGPSSPTLIPAEERLGLVGQDASEDPAAGRSSWLASVSKAAGGGVVTAQGAEKGVVEHLFDLSKLRTLSDFNIHHAACLEAKVSATVGQGWVSPKIAEVLDPLCETSFDDLCEKVVGDLEELGNGAIEVVRDKSGQVAALYYADPTEIHIVLEDEKDPRKFYYEMELEGSAGGPVQFAPFGKLGEVRGKPAIKNELIWIADPARGSKYYGKPSWVSAISKMELEQAITQHNFDFFWNRCVPELLFLVTGGQVTDDDWTKIEERFTAHAGLKRQRKTMALNLPGQEMEVAVHPLGGEISGETDGFGAFADSLAVLIVSAHRVPPLLAGIQIPGKMGAANEMSNSIMAFQALVVEPRQKAISKLFARTLGDSELTGGLQLTADHFLGKDDPRAQEQDPLEVESGIPAAKPKDRRNNGLITITEVLDLGQMETSAKMRMSLAEAKARGRDMGAGPAERGSDVAAGRGNGTVAGGAS